MLLAGDIGGTKTVLAVFSQEKGAHEPIVVESFPSNRYGRLEAIIREFLTRYSNYPISHACFGVAGPVVEGKASITNLPWVIDEAVIQEQFGWEHVRLLNDLESLAYAVPILELDDLHTLNVGSPVAKGNIAVIAPGTGLGEAFLTWDRDHYHAHASEGGHASFSPDGDLQIGLLRYMHETLGHGHVSFERVCSGLGIPNIYAYLKHSNYAEEPAWLTEALADATDHTPIISSAVETCELARKTMSLFIQIAGGEAGNLALKILATGGVYLGGGIPPRILPSLLEGGFFESFCHKGRFKGLLAQIPIHVILNSQAGLLGAAACGLTEG